MKKLKLLAVVAILALLVAAFTPLGARYLGGFNASEDSWVRGGSDIIWYNSVNVSASGETHRIDGAGGAVIAAPTAVGTSTPAAVLQSDGVSNPLEVRNASGTPMAQYDRDGNFFNGVVAYTLTGARTLTATGRVYAVSPTAVLTLTLAAGTAGQELLIFNTVTTSTTIVDTGATQGGGNITLGQDDMAHLIFIDGTWIEISSPDNS